MEFSIYNVVYKKTDGTLLKFGVIVSADFKDLDKINEYADNLLEEESINADVVFSADECDFCDMAITSEKVINDIIEKGYSIFKHWGFTKSDIEIAVYDTYVEKKDGTLVYHFDILVEKNKFKTEEVIDFGKEYLNSIDASFNKFSVDECQFCYLELPTEKILNVINTKGHYILPLKDIATTPPENPTRSQMIQYIRATNKLLRFSNFVSKSTEDISKIIANEKK